MTPLARRFVWTIILLSAIAIAAVFPGHAHAAGLRIPEASARYRLQLERAAGQYFGLDAPSATLAAQIHQESGWRPDAQSPYAQGLSQFTPVTAKWLPSVCPETGAPDPWDPAWSIGAIACYDAWLLGRVQPFGKSRPTTCSRWAFALRAYNGGETALARERRLALAANQDANDWRIVAHYRARATWAHRQNTDYPRRILLLIEPLYRAAGWSGRSTC